MWQHEIPDDLPRERIRDEVVAEGTRRRRRRARRVQGLAVAALVLVAAPVVLLDRRQPRPTHLLAGPTTTASEATTTPEPPPAPPTTAAAPAVEHVPPGPPTKAAPPTTARARPRSAPLPPPAPPTTEAPPPLASCEEPLYGPPMGLTLTSDASRYLMGEPVRFTLTLTNKSSRPCRLPSDCESTTDRSVFIVTVSEQGVTQEIWRAAYFRPCSPTILAPGQSFSGPMLWCQEVNGGNGTGLDPTSPCEARTRASSAGPGEYTAKAYWHTARSGSADLGRATTSFSLS